MKNCRTLFLILVIVPFLSLPLMSMTYHGTPYSMQQPDGSMVDVLLYGSDVYIDVESEDHYTLIKDEETGAICYAMVSSDGNAYASTGIVYKGGETPDRVKSILQPKLRISKTARDSIIRMKSQLIGKDHTRATLKATSIETASVLPDTIYGVCVLIDFQDVKSAVSRENIEVFLNSDDRTVYRNAMSIKKYFEWISGGKLTYINYLPSSFYTAPNRKDYYSPADATDYTTDLFFPVIESALLSYTKEKDGFDLSDLTKRDGAVCAINVFYAGTCENKWATGLWPHQGYHRFNLTKYGYSRNAWHAYQMTYIGNELNMGTFVHENGHLVCEWPDFYSYDGHEDNNAKDYNIGDAFSIPDQKNPSYPNPWALDQVGWLTHKIDITDIHDGRLITLKRECGYAAVYRGTGKNKKEKFYLEIRDKHYKSINNHKGIFIWHSNDDGTNTEEGYDELLDCRPATIRNPFWVAGNGPSAFDDNSDPNARWVDGANSGAYFWDFSQYGETMTFRCGPLIEDPEFLTSSLLSGRLKGTYSAEIEVHGGNAPYMFSLEEGSLPDGLTLSESGVIEGIPTALGKYSFSVKVTDADGKSTVQAFDIDIITSTPYGGERKVIPGRIEMEYFDEGGQDIAYNEYDQVNLGSALRPDNASVYIQSFRRGYAIMQTGEGEWTHYSVRVDSSGLYEVSFHHCNSSDVEIKILVDDEDETSVMLPGVRNANGSFENGYMITTAEINLTEGEHIIHYELSDLMNYSPKVYMDYMQFDLLASTNVKDENNDQDRLICPNPSASEFVLESPMEGRIEVVSCYGVIIDNWNVEEDSTIRFGADYTPGVYFVKIYAGDEVYVKKILKK